MYAQCTQLRGRGGGVRGARRVGWFCHRCGESGECAESEDKRAEAQHMRECPGDYDPDQGFEVYDLEGGVL
jgi:hypothetical protein